jgi:phosphoribosylanthranilate isomerase
VIRVKVCGITRRKDARLAVDLGADALGFIFYPKSPRYIEPEKAAEIIRGLPPFVGSVGVFVDAPARRVRSVVRTCSLSAVQLHGEESPEFCSNFSVKVIKGFRVKGNRLPRGISRYAVDALLLDTFKTGVPGGTGEVFPWEVARRAERYGRIILAGGLKPGNVRRAVETVRPFAVDVSSGVESAPGRKDIKLLEAFFDQVNKVR